MQFDPIFRSRRSNVLGTRGIVATSQPLAAGAGLDMLKAGGNAADAAVISGEDSDVMVGVEPTNEEWVAAVEARAAISHRASP